MSDTTAADPTSAPVPGDVPAKDTNKSFLARIDITSFIALLIVAAFIAMCFLLIFKAPDGNNQFVIGFVMVLATLTGLVVNHFYGSSTGSRAKDDTIAALAEKK